MVESRAKRSAAARRGWATRRRHMGGLSTGGARHRSTMALLRRALEGRGFESFAERSAAAKKGWAHRRRY